MDRKSGINDRIKIVYYTHPFCRDSQRMQENWDRLVSVCGELVSFQLCMMPKESVQKNEWNENLFENNCHLACVAVKSASLQSELAAHCYLTAIREAVFPSHQDISKIEILVEVARQVSRSNREVFSLQRFSEDFNSVTSRPALDQDHRKAHVNRIQESPTFTFTIEGKGVKVAGYQSFERILGIITTLVARSDIGKRLETKLLLARAMVQQ